MRKIEQQHIQHLKERLDLFGRLVCICECVCLCVCVLVCVCVCGNMVRRQLQTAWRGLIRQVFLFGSLYTSMYIVGTVGTVLIREVPLYISKVL